MCLRVAYGWRCRRRKDRRNRHSRHLKRKEKLWTDFFFAECCCLSNAIAPFCLVFSCPTTAVLCFAFFDGEGQRIVSMKGGSVGLTPSCSHTRKVHIFTAHSGCWHYSRLNFKLKIIGLLSHSFTFTHFTRTVRLTQQSGCVELRLPQHC